jgi:biopolymer transport protein ExbB
MPDFVEKAGPLIYAIFAASVVGVGYIIYCFLVLRRKIVLRRQLVEMTDALGGGGDYDAVLAECKKDGGPFAEIVHTVIDTREASRDEAEAMVESAGRRAAHDLSHGILALEVVAAISPLLGLLGTVMGMHKVFDQIKDVGVKEIGMLSGGISEALITTIAGLLVAIPAYVAYTYFSRRIDSLVLEMEQHAMTLMARIRKNSGGAA